MLALDPILLARIQFAFTISFHIIFPVFTIGLASFLAVIEWRWLRTNNSWFKDLYKFWIKIFAVTFGMGVVSGIVMSYQFGTNWSIFSDRTANVLGPLLGYEVLTAFFLEASFLGVMLFGWDRVNRRVHFLSTCIVAVGTLISAFWILSANSWMQTPQGYEIASDGRLMPLNWISIIFNPSFPYRLFHMVIAAYLTTAFIIGGVGALYLLKNRFIDQAKIMFKMAVVLVALLAPVQLVVGDLHGLNTLKHQPIKIAAMEGIWDTERDAGLRLFAIPDQEAEKNHYEIKIPYLASYVLTHNIHGEIKGLKNWPKAERPQVIWSFFCFRIMVGIGLLMIMLGIVSVIQLIRGKLMDSGFLKKAWVVMMPSGFLAVLAGWFVTETGRQPYTVYGVVKTIESATPAIHGAAVAWSLLTFVLVYSFIFTAAIYYIIKIIRQGIPAGKEKEQYYSHSMEASAMETEGDAHV